MSSLILALLISATPAEADCRPNDCDPQGPVLAIGDLQIGDPLTDSFAEAHCPEHTAKQIDRLCRKRMYLKSGGEVDLIYHFSGGELMQISMSFDPALFNELVRRYADILDKTPDETWQEDLTTRGGEVLTADAVAWRTYSGPFVIKEFGASTLRGHAQLGGEMEFDFEDGLGP